MGDRQTDGYFKEQLHKRIKVDDTQQILCNITVISKVQCTSHCLTTVGCAAVNFNLQYSNCECISEAALQNDMLVNSEDWTYMSVQKTSTTFGK